MVQIDFLAANHVRIAGLHVWSELKPEVVLATIIDPKGVNSLKMPINGLGLPCLQVLLAFC